MLKNKRQKQKQTNYVTLETYSEPCNDVSRVFLGRPVHTLNLPKRHHDWRRGKNVSKLLLADALKLHSLALFALRFLCKTFPKNYIMRRSSIRMMFQNSKIQKKFELL